jgi:hypothetical protein
MPCRAAQYPPTSCEPSDGDESAEGDDQTGPKTPDNIVVSRAQKDNTQTGVQVLSLGLPPQPQMLDRPVMRASPFRSARSRLLEPATRRRATQTRLIRGDLLRQPGGFERFLPLLVHAEALDRPVADRERPGGPSPHLDSIASERMQRPRDHHVVTRLDELVRLDPCQVPDADKLIQNRANLIAPVDPRFGPAARDQSSSKSGAASLKTRSQSSRLNASMAARAI